MRKRAGVIDQLLHHRREIPRGDGEIEFEFLEDQIGFAAVAPGGGFSRLFDGGWQRFRIRQAEAPTRVPGHAMQLHDFQIILQSAVQPPGRALDGIQHGDQLILWRIAQAFPQQFGQSENAGQGREKFVGQGRLQR